MNLFATDFTSTINFLSSPLLWISIVALYTLKKAIHFVPQNRGYVIYTFGKYTRTLSSGPNFIIPFIQSVAANRNMKEQTLAVSKQSAITKDNISLDISAVLYIKVVDAGSATNSVDDYKRAVTELAMTTMRSSIGGMMLDECFQNRDTINTQVTTSMEGPTSSWGVKVTRYEIKDIIVPPSIKEDMERQMSAERLKRSNILEAEGFKSSEILKAEGEKRSIVLRAEANKEQQVLIATGEQEATILDAKGKSKAIELIATAEAMALEKIGTAASTDNGKKAVQFKITQEAISAHREIADKGTVVLSDGNTGENIANTIAQCAAVSNALNNVTDELKDNAS